jgi:hypothetical protein
MWIVSQIACNRNKETTYNTIDNKFNLKEYTFNSIDNTLNFSYTENQKLNEFKYKSNNEYMINLYKK